MLVNTSASSEPRRCCDAQPFIAMMDAEVQVLPEKRGRPKKTPEPVTAATTRKTKSTRARKSSSTSRASSKDVPHHSTKTPFTLQSTGKAVEESKEHRIQRTVKAAEDTLPVQRASKILQDLAAQSNGFRAELAEATRVLRIIATSPLATSLSNHGQALGLPSGPANTSAHVSIPRTVSSGSVFNFTATNPTSPPTTSPAAPPPASKLSPTGLARAQGQASSDAPPTLKQMNAHAVNSLAARANSSRPPNISKGTISAKYKPTARRITTIMVALPVVVITSWLLYDRSEYRLLLKIVIREHMSESREEQANGNSSFRP